MAITTENLVQFYKGLSANLPASRNANTLYFCTDTHQVYLGADEYTKGTKVLNAEPTSSTVGDLGRLYAYNGGLYLCTDITGGSYTYVRVANVNDFAGVTSVAAGEGLETDVIGAISSTGTISHSVPNGASVVTNPVSDASPSFGGTFAIQGVATDKFGHVIGSTASTITLPTETALTVEAALTSTVTLAHGGTFAAITNVAEGSADQSIKPTVTTFTIPHDRDTTYQFATSSSVDGGITVTPSDSSSYDVVPKGWSDLAKKSDITSVFKYKGTKASVAELPTDGQVGDVWQVGNAEYVCVTAGEGATAAVWEELGPIVDLSAYALSEDVIQRVSPATAGNVPKLKADGTLEDTGFELGCSVPSTAVFTDTTYDPVQASPNAAPGLMTGADKVKLDAIEADADVNVIESVSVAGVAISPDANKNVDIELSNFGITKTATQINDIVEAGTWQSFPTT